MFDTILENGTIIDGSGGAPYRADVGLKDRAISAIGDLKETGAATRFDLRGKTVCPGFIDVHSHGDLAFFRKDHDRLLSPLVKQGITTFVGGNCGMALAPITEENRDSIKTYLEVFTQMDFDNDIHWDTMGSYLEHMDEKGLLLNTAQLVPHGVIRISASGMNDRPANQAETAVMSRLLEESLEAGAFGLSTGLQYAPGLHSDTPELTAVAAPLARHDGIFTSHLRSYTSTTLGRAIEEVDRVARHNDIQGHISHVFSVPWTGPIHNLSLKVIKWLARHGEAAVKLLPEALLDAEMNKILKQVEAARAGGSRLTMDVMPTTAGFTHLLAFFPPWALTGTRQDVLARVKDRKTRREMRRDIEQGRPVWPHRGKNDWSLNMIRQMGWDALTVMAVHGDKNKHLEGRRFTDIAAERHQHPFEVMCDLLVEEDGRVLVFESISDPDDAFTERYTFPALKDPRTMITTDTILLGMGRPSYLFHGCYPKFINRYVYRFNLLELPAAIARLTSLPAREFGIQHRGLVKEGFHADLLVLDPEKFRTSADFNDPARDPEGLDMVFINGHLVVKDNQMKYERLPGMMLRKNHQPAPA